MSNPDAYVSLIASLPRSERLFVAKQPPISRLRLEKRLSVLTLEDRALLGRIETALSWRAYGMDDTGRDAIARVEALLAELDSDTLRAIVTERMDMRTTIAALRLRARGESPPAAPWGPSRLTTRIAANWSDPTFKLDARLPWLREALGFLQRQDPMGLERHIVDASYRQLNRHDARHGFDFEAVVIYVLKWNIFDRWARSDARAASARFEALAQAALSEVADLSLEGA